MLEIFFSKQATKFLDVCKDSERIRTKINLLKNSPIPKSAVRVRGAKEKLFRIRIGKIRVLYEVDLKNNVIGIVKIDKRERVY